MPNGYINQRALFDQYQKYFGFKNRNPNWTKNYGGLCFGYSIVWSANRNFESMLRAISNWDGVTDPKRIITDFKELRTQRFKSLEEVFEEVIHYITFNYADRSIGIENLNQIEFLKTSTHYLQFEIDVPDENKNFHTKKIISQKLLTGNFNSESLTALLILNKKIFTGNNICLTLNEYHTCALKVQEDVWWFYDCNYPEGKKVFYQTQDLVFEIMKVLGNALNFVISSFESKIEINGYLTLIHDPRMPLLEGRGLHMMILHNPNLLFFFIQEAKNYLFGSIKISLALIQKDFKGRSGFYQVIRYYPQMIAELITLVGRIALLQALSVVDDEGNHGLHAFASYSPDYLIDFLNFMLVVDSDYQKVAQLLVSENKLGGTPLESLRVHYPEILPQVFAIALTAGSQKLKYRVFSRPWFSDEVPSQYLRLEEWRHAKNKTVEDLRLFIKWLGIPSGQNKILFEKHGFDLPAWINSMKLFSDFLAFIFFMDVPLSETSEFFSKNGIDLMSWLKTYFTSPKDLDFYSRILSCSTTEPKSSLEFFHPTTIKKRELCENNFPSIKGNYVP